MSVTGCTRRSPLRAPLSRLPSCLPTRAPPTKAISRDTIMPAAWNPPWTLGVRVRYTPVKSNALMNLPRAETVTTAPGRPSPLLQRPQPAPSGIPPCLHPSSAADQGSVAMTQTSTLAPGKALPRRRSKYEHFSCISDLEAHLAPQNKAGLEGGALLHPPVT